MKNMVEIRWHGRGGQGAKTACLLRLNPHMEFVIYTLDFRCAAALPDLFAKLGIGETEVIQITVSRMNAKHNFTAEPAPWLITGRGGV